MVCTSLQFIIKHIIYVGCIYIVVCTSLQFIIKHIIYVRCIYTVVCTSLQLIIKHIIYVRCIYTVVSTSLQFIIKKILFLSFLICFGISVIFCLFSNFFPNSVSFLNYNNIAYFFTFPWPLGLCSHDNAIYLFHTNNFNKYLNNFSKLLKMSNSSKNKT